MLATKNRAGREFQIFFLLLAVLIAGCTPPGSRALLDGKRLLDESKYSEAVEKLKLATSLLTTNAQAWNYLGVAYHRAGQTTNAAAAYKKALDLNRDLLEVRYNLGCLWLDQNKLDAAKAEFTAYTLRRANAAEGWLKLGTAQLRGREANAAEKSFREALRLNPQNVEALNGLGLVQLQRNRPRDAAQSFAAALKQQADYRPALLNLATVLDQHLNDRAGALEKYREYLALKPKPENWETVNAIVTSLEQPAAVAQRPPPTNVVTRPIANTNATRAATGTVARVVVPPKVEPTPVVTRTPPAPPPANAAAVEVVQLPPEPVIKTSPDTPARAAIPTNQPRAAEPDVPAPSPVTTAAGAESAKPGFFSRINPLTLFRREPKSTPSPTPLPPSKKTSAAPTTPESRTSSPSQREQESAATLKDETSLSNGSSAAPSGSPNVVERSAFSRYTYLAPAKAPVGDRREAERAFGQGQRAHRANRLAEAVASFRQATLVDPGYFEAYYNLGLAAYEYRSYRQALSAWENALAIQPESNDARYNFALTLKAANYPVDAANELERILAANSKETRAHLVLGNLYAEQLHDPGRARAHYLKVLELEPQHPQANSIRYWLVGNPP
jgi:Flp pilus assembly protein TadD